MVLSYHFNICDRDYRYVAFHVLDGFECELYHRLCCQTLLYCEVIDGKLDKNRCGKCHTEMIEKTYNAKWKSYDYKHLVTCEYNGIVVSFKYLTTLSNKVSKVLYLL